MRTTGSSQPKYETFGEKLSPLDKNSISPKKKDEPDNALARMKNLVASKRVDEGRDKSIPPLLVQKPDTDDSLTEDESLKSSIHSDVAAYGIDMDKIRLVEKMYNEKAEKKKLNTKQLAIRKELTGARCLFEMDQYVKLSEVRQVVKDALMSIVDRMVKADDHQKANTATL